MKANAGSWVKQNLFLVLGVGGGIFLCCTIVLIAVFLRMSTNSTPLISNDVKPSHYGVFVKQGGDLIELQEQEIFSIPVEQEMSNTQAISDHQPVIVVWRANVNLDYLEFYKLNQYLGQPKNDVRYTVTPKNDGVYELTPTSSLSDGIYCLIQGDPLAVTLPGWCFRLGSVSSNEPSINLSATTTTDEDLTSVIKPSFATCSSYEYANEWDKAQECYENWTLAEPNNSFAWLQSARVYGIVNNYQSALDASLQSFDVATIPDEEIQALASVGVFYYQLGEYAMAVSYLEKGAQIDQSTITYLTYRADILVWLSRSYEANSQKTEACLTWKETLELAKRIDYEWAINWANSGVARCA